MIYIDNQKACNITYLSYSSCINMLHISNYLKWFIKTKQLISNHHLNISKMKNFTLFIYGAEVW